MEKPHSPACFSVFVPISGLQRHAEAPLSGLIAYEAESVFKVPWPNSKLPIPKFGGFRHGLLGIIDWNSPIRKELRADIIGGTSFVSVDLGDFDTDADTLFLEVFDAANVSLGFTSQLIAADFTGMRTLSLSAANIDHAVFGARAPAFNGSSVIADNFTFTSGAAQVPEPATLLPAGLSMLGLAVSAMTRRRASHLASGAA